MTIGIYALYWEEQDLIYIGQSQNIERRWKEHIADMQRNVHHNYKVQLAYNSYGIPRHIVLDTCSISKLDELEAAYTNEFCSLNNVNGLNIVEAGNTGWGINGNNSRYTKRQILSIFSLLYKGVMTCPQIATRLGVNTSTVENICGSSHIWLKEEYPVEYNLMKSVDRSRRKQEYKPTLKYRGSLVDTSGNIYEVYNISQFAKEHGCDQGGISKVLLGAQSSCKQFFKYNK